MLRIIRVPFLGLSNQIMYVYRAPLAVADDHFRNTVVVDIGDLDGTYVLRRGDRPARKFVRDIIGINVLPRLGGNQLLVSLSRYWCQSQMRSKPVIVGPLNRVGGRIHYLSIGRGDFDRRIQIHLSCDQVVTTNTRNLPE